MKLLMAHRGRPGEAETEAEPVVLQVTDSTVVLTLDDGEGLQFDLGELREVLDTEVAQRAVGRHGSFTVKHP